MHLTQNNIEYNIKQGSANKGPNLAHGLFLYILRAKNVFHIFKELEIKKQQPKRMYN